MYWNPDTTSTDSLVTSAPASASALVSDGFTFTSPPVYVFYYGLPGLWNCDVPYNLLNSDFSTIDTVHDSVNIVYEPSA
ncbi:hypothetical protein ABVK25_000694 [Lepraria finkii]|uniref:Uncharacterized protein n=1 Tax=Lepraria finkii TaxID=1340010 RepID=A0ABR4BQW0_9LECA